MLFDFRLLRNHLGIKYSMHRIFYDVHIVPPTIPKHQRTKIQTKNKHKLKDFQRSGKERVPVQY